MRAMSALSDSNWTASCLGYQISVSLPGWFEALDVRLLNNILFHAMGAWVLHKDLHISSGDGTESAMDAIVRAMTWYLEERGCRGGSGTASSQVRPSLWPSAIARYTHQKSLAYLIK